MGKGFDPSWVFIAVLLLGLYLIFGVDSQGTNKPGAPLRTGREISEKEKTNRVNEHLQETALQLEQDRIRRLLEAQKELQKLNNTDPQEKYTRDQELTFESDASMNQLTEQLNQSQGMDDDQLTPEQIVNNRLLELQQERRADQAYREEYVRRFIENAREGGWDIRLGPNLEVLSVKKIRRRPSLFDVAPSE